MTLLGQSRDSWPSMAPLGHVELTKMQKIIESKNKNQNQNENKDENSFLFSFSFLFLFHFCFCFSVSFLLLFPFSFLFLFFAVVAFFLFFFFFYFLVFFLNFTMAPLGHHTKAYSKMTTKSTGTASGNVFRVSLSLTWNIILKPVTEFAFSKASGLYEKWHWRSLWWSLWWGLFWALG